MNDESSKYQAVAGTIVNTLSNSRPGFHLEIEADMGFCMGDRVWISRKAPASQPAEQPRGDLDKAVHAIDDLVALNGEEHDEAAWKLIRDRIVASQPKAATEVQVEQVPRAWLYTWRDILHEAEQTVVADACEERARKRAAEVGATIEPLYTHPAPSQAVRALDEAMLRAGTDAAIEWHRGIPQELRTTDQLREQWAWLVEKILAAAIPSPAAEQAVATAGDGVTEDAPLAGHWRHGNGFICCGQFRIAREDWEAGVCAAPGMRAEVFDWMCRKLNASPSAPRVGVPDGWTRALDAAVAAIYFADSSDYETALWQVVKHLKPDLVDLLQSDESAAYEQVKAMLAAAPEVDRG